MTPLRGVRGDEGIAPYGCFIEVRLCNGWNTEKPRRDHRDRGGVGTPERIRTAGLPLRSYNIRVVPCSTPCFKMSANPHEYRIFY